MSAQQFDVKSVTRFNNLVLLFLQDVAESVNDPLVMTAWTSAIALFRLQPQSTKVVTQFMNCMQGAADFIAARNVDILQKAGGQSSSLITSEQLVGIYRQMTEAQIDVCWKYMSRLYTLGAKACPHLHREADFDFNNILSSEPMNSIIKHRTSSNPSLQQQADSTAVAADSSSDEDATGIIPMALAAAARDMVRAIDTAAVSLQNASLSSTCKTTLQLLEGADDPDCSKLVTCISATYTVDDMKNMLLYADAVLYSRGFPLLGCGEAVKSVLQKAPNGKSVAASCVQVCMLALILKTMPPEAIASMEDLAGHFCDKIATGEINLQETMNPVAALRVLCKGGMADKIAKIVSQMRA